MAKAEWVSEDSPEFPVPTVEKFPCPRCGAEIQVVADVTETDYTDRALEYIHKTENRFHDTIKELDEMFPDTPIKEYMDKKCENVMRALNLLSKSFDEGLSFEERCELENIMEDFE